MPLAKDVLHPSQEEEKRKHQKKCLVQSPNSYLMGVRCPGCYKVTHNFSHTQTVVLLLVSLLSSDSLQEERQGFQKDAPSDRSNTESTLHQNELETIPINTLWIYIYRIKISRNTSTNIQMFKLTPVCFRDMEVSARSYRRVEPSCPWEQESEKGGIQDCSFYYMPQ